MLAKRKIGKQSQPYIIKYFDCQLQILYFIEIVYDILIFALQLHEIKECLSSLRVMV